MHTAIQAIYRDLEYAKSLVKARMALQGAATLRSVDIDEGEGEEESWTFIGDEGDPELQKRIHDGEAAPSPAPVPVPTRGRAPRVSLERAGTRAMAGVEPIRKVSVKR